jgi:LysR family glycine cleavage system transcriptional activator
MQRLRSKLPPLNSIVTFEAAARHLSFTRAAEELLISREAVSRSVAALEAHLGVRLFVRRHRALALTSAGEGLRVGVSEGLERIARSVERTRPKAQTRHATVWATIALAHFWLTPRLPRFRARHKDIELHVRASDTWLDMEVENIDVALRYGPGQWPGLKAHHLFDTQTFPVCAPRYLVSAPPLRTVQDLVRHTLLNLDGDAHADEDWSWWLSESGVSPARRPAMVGFDSYADVIEATLDGQGIALGFTHVVDNLMSSGALVRPLPTVLSRGYGVYAVAPRATAPSAAARALVSWLVAEARTARSMGGSSFA